MIICARCGHENAQTLTFCEECDVFLEWNTAPPGTRPAPVPQPAAPAAPAPAPVETPPDASPTPDPGSPLGGPETRVPWDPGHEPAATPPMGTPALPDAPPGDSPASTPLVAPRPPTTAPESPATPTPPVAPPAPTAPEAPAPAVARPGAPPAAAAARATRPVEAPRRTPTAPRPSPPTVARVARPATDPQPGSTGRAQPPASPGRPQSPATRARTGGAARPESPAAQVAADLEVCLDKARAAGRDDLVERLLAAQRLLGDRELSVVVAGEFKQGKSSLVNAIVKTEVCPVDDDIVTAVPTIVRYGERAGAFVHVTPTGNGAAPADADGAGLPIALEQVGPYVRGEVSPGDDAEVRSVEVRLARAVLKAGLTFVDTPGVGGLESAEGSVVLGVLDMADAMLFVTDAAQELTRPEISFLQAAVTRCPNVVCVVTKTDLHADWRRMVELDRGHLADAGLDVPVLAVTSFLRMRAASTGDDAMNVESGFPPLFDLLRSRVVAAGRSERLAQAAAEVDNVARSLARAPRAAAAVIARPERAGEVVADLTRASEASAALQGSGAEWQRVLSDGIQDLVANVEHHLRTKLTEVVRAGEDIISRADPADSWAEFEVWLRRQVVAAAVETYDLLGRLAAELTERVGAQFRRDSDDPIALPIAPPVAALEQVTLGGQFDRKGVRSSVVLSAARGSYGGMLMFGMAGSLLGVPFAPAIAVALSLGLGRRSVREERKRQHQQNQAQARAALQRYAGEVGRLVDKECRDALRHTQRLLRDEFTARARSLHQSDALALAEARRAMVLDAAAQEARHADAVREVDELGGLGVMTLGPAPPARAFQGGGP